MSWTTRRAGPRSDTAAQPAPITPAIARGAAVASFLAGLWLVMAPFALRYQSAEDGFDRHWTSVLAGSVVLVCSLVHAMAPRETPWLLPVLFAVGAWLVVAPLVTRYPVAGHAAANDSVTGAVVVLATLSSAAAALRRGPRLRLRDRP
ncbi:hypothetical protein JOF41_003658 [Saccharothrix coeruleofusca]|uniref:SPW repeat domain-containing protein n=1 Tax=Saccharothrix coeruleofusca TaxID=33919 RepID=UPI001AE6EAA5|nr:SPW repeat protein [Saccharothrix coeruleofusca]MBP2337480.1 hypothetical protein [Saccharothrix coeruleofusca]